jgi:hypothetical protein
MLLLTMVAHARVARQIPASGQPLNVYLSNTHATSPLVLETLRNEVEELLEPAHLTVHWHDGKGNVPGQLAVIRLQGDCRADAPLPFGLTVGGTQDPEALGRTHVSNGVVLPFADIRCDQLRHFIQGPLRSGHNREAREQMLGRALARVIAHELYHILLRTTSHGKSGVARATQTAERLVAPRISFSRADERRLAIELGGVAESTLAEEDSTATDADLQRGQNR